MIQEKVLCDVYQKRNESVWTVESNIDRFNQEFTMGFKNNEKRKFSEEIYVVNVYKTKKNKCYLMLFIESKDKNANFNVTITARYKNGSIKSCKFMNLKQQC